MRQLRLLRALPSDCLTRHSEPIARGARIGSTGIALLAALGLTACGTQAASPPTTAAPVDCAALPPADLLRLDGRALFASAFAAARCESEAITAGEVLAAGSLAIVAPSPGFTDQEVTALVTDVLEPAGLQAAAIHFYVLGTDRVTVTRFGPMGSIEETLQAATGAIAEAFAEDGRTGAEDRVAWVIEVRSASADPESVTRVLDTLREGGYAFMIGENVGFPPPFDPARDRSAAELSEAPGA